MEREEGGPRITQVSSLGNKVDTGAISLGRSKGWGHGVEEPFFTGLPLET